MKNSKGQSLIEYCMVILVLSTVSFFGWQLFADNLAVGLDIVFNRLSSTGNGKAMAAKPGNNAGGGGNGSGSGNLSENMVDMVVTLPDGSKMKLTNTPSDISKIIETTGANGATDLLAFTLMDLATKLVESGEMTEDQASYLVDLANQGHRMAAIQRAVEEGVQAAGEAGIPVSDYMVMFEGKEVPLRNLSNRVGLLWTTTKDMAAGGYNILNVPDMYANDPNHVSDIGVDLNTFRELFNAADQNGSLNDPVIRDMVTKLALDIGNIGDSLENQLEKMQAAERDAIASGSQPPIYTKDILNAMVGASNEITDNNSATICTAGNASDSGVLCTGKGGA